MTLIILQKVFSLTHNDLHTNNIMYVTTPLAYIKYVYMGKTYVIPTYGRIYKIIDFGRSIYRFKDKQFCSDSFEKSGDASGQYNMKYFNHNSLKPWIEPNFSFDLCRLGVSLYYLTQEHLYTGLKVNSKMKLVYNLIDSWCKDDLNKNILFKNNSERYPGFKLYKMIARNVHNHLPSDQVSNSIFKQYLVDKINNIDSIHIDNISLNDAYNINVDNIPQYYNA